MECKYVRIFDDSIVQIKILLKLNTQKPSYHAAVFFSKGPAV